MSNFFYAFSFMEIYTYIIYLEKKTDENKRKRDVNADSLLSWPEQNRSFFAINFKFIKELKP